MLTFVSPWQALEEEGTRAGLVVDMVHRKINLQEDTQAWEHEKYSMRRLPAFTLSRLQVLGLSLWLSCITVAATRVFDNLI